MTKFMVLYVSPISAREQMANSTPEQREAGMQAWMSWAAKAGDAIVDLGSPVAPAAHVGPHSTSGEAEVGGFSIMQAESVDVINDLLAGHPHLEWGGSIDVLEFLPMSGAE